MLCLLASKGEDTGARVRVRGVWDAEVNRGEKVIGIRKFEETERRLSFVRRGIRKQVCVGRSSPATNKKA